MSDGGDVEPMRVLVLGAGYSGVAIGRALVADGAEVLGTRREEAGLAALARAGLGGLRADLAADGRDLDAGLVAALAETTHLIVSVPPAREPPRRDPALESLGPMLLTDGAPRLCWIGYLSTIGVYGDHGGALVDEDAPCVSVQARSVARVAAERGWAALGERLRVPLARFRLAGIYGPGRNAVADALAGRARVIEKPGHLFNRVHVEDIARLVARAARARTAGALNVSDEEPAPQSEVVRHAHALLGREPPAAVPFERAELSPMARSFWAEAKRVDNARAKRLLAFGYRYPSYREGLASLVASERARLGNGAEG